MHDNAKAMNGMQTKLEIPLVFKFIFVSSKASNVSIEINSSLCLGHTATDGCPRQGQTKLGGMIQQKFIFYYGSQYVTVLSLQTFRDILGHC